MEGSIREDNIASMKAYKACGVKISEEYKWVDVPNENKQAKMFMVYIDFEENMIRILHI